MKGPSGRLRLQIRRLWQCPACGRREWTSGQVVTRACTCTPADASHPVWMTLVADHQNPYTYHHAESPPADKSSPANPLGS